jgi:hypothetical protein
MNHKARIIPPGSPLERPPKERPPLVRVVVFIVLAVHLVLLAGLRPTHYRQSEHAQLHVMTSNDNHTKSLGKIMRTMMELLIRLQEVRTCCERVERNPQLTDEEKTAAYCFKRVALLGSSSQFASRVTGDSPLAGPSCLAGAIDVSCSSPSSRR